MSLAKTRRLERNIRSSFSRYPLRFGAAATLLGFLAGIALRPTRLERQILGRHSKRLVHKAKRRARRGANHWIEQAADRLAGR